MDMPLKTSGYASVNGLELYYDIRGRGRPLILLHGGMHHGESFKDLWRVLEGEYCVITADLQGHGRTADVDRPLDFASLADDVVALMDHLQVARANVMGYALGGSVALSLALAHPDRVHRLALVSTPFSLDGWHPEILNATAQMGPTSAEVLKSSQIFSDYADVAPRPGDWPVLLDKLAELARQPYDLGEAVSALSMPVMLVYGDSDSIGPGHAAEFFNLLGGGLRDGGWDDAGKPKCRLAILPDETHHTIYRSPLLAPVVIPFLDEESEGT